MTPTMLASAQHMGIVSAVFLIWGFVGTGNLRRAACAADTPQPRSDANFVGKDA
ncbi:MULTISPECIES: hypothetical protein [unclassified Rhodococcus (in: high G+C Gram-positive bacteria)]|uniref:hypothetical protein n=1 Tax=unclassified Rhodococcus (in: high G+C Gram-positive bacteria) TaxID=192944 RepID=UPI0014460E16|nr:MULTISPECIES: hypothetical protein [unclassified Rhodococcus (in: high G+C Gram-positive bacteria)]